MGAELNTSSYTEQHTELAATLPQKNIQRDVTSQQDFKKSHELVFSRQKLTSREQDIFALVLCHMKKDDWGTVENPLSPCYTIPAANISEMLDIESKDLASTLNKPCQRLSNRTVGMFDQKTHSFEYTPYFKKIKYHKGVLTIIPNEELRDDYIGGAKGFALINRKAFVSLNRDPSKRLYDLLSRFKDKSKGKIPKTSLDDLKGLFGLVDEKGNIRENCKSFKRNTIFIKRFVIESIAELENNPLTKNKLLFHTSDKGEYGYKLYKTSHKYTHIEFLYSWVMGPNDSAIGQLNLEDALNTIKRLESRKKFLSAANKKLPTAELELLYANYKIATDSAPDNIRPQLNQQVNNIKKALDKRAEEEFAEAQKTQAVDFAILDDFLVDNETY